MNQEGCPSQTSTIPCLFLVSQKMVFSVVCLFLQHPFTEHIPWRGTEMSKIKRPVPEELVNHQGSGLATARLPDKPRCFCVVRGLAAPSCRMAGPCPGPAESEPVLAGAWMVCAR